MLQYRVHAEKEYKAVFHFYKQILVIPPTEFFIIGFVVLILILFVCLVGWFIDFVSCLLYACRRSPSFRSFVLLLKGLLETMIVCSQM